MLWPPEHLIKEEPDECAVQGTFLSSGGVATYQPGNYYAYNSFPVNNEPAVLEPGVYCVKGQFQSTKDVTGEGVFIYIHPETKTRVNLTGGNYDLTAPDSGDYAGYLIYQDWVVGMSAIDTCTIAGGSTTSFSGLIFVPYCNLEISGTTEPGGMNAQIISWQISLSGTMDLNFVYESDALPHIPETFKTGLSR